MEACRRQVAAAGIACSAALLAVAPVPWQGLDSGTRTGTTQEAQPFPRDLLDGDIVFRRGKDAVSRIALMYVDRPRFSHVGLIVRTGESFSVVHAIPRERDFEGGVREEPLASFSAPTEAEEVAFYRVDALSPQQRKALRGYLLASIGMPFDYEFRYSDSNAHYCSELVVKALAAAGLNIASELRFVEAVTLAEPAIPPDAIRNVRLLRQIVDLSSDEGRSGGQ